MEEEQTNVEENVIDTLLSQWTDEEVLENIAKFLDRVSISNQFASDEDGLVTHQVLTIQCGEHGIFSEPQELGWPLQRLPMPEAFKGKLN